MPDALRDATLRQLSATEAAWRGRRLAYFGGSDYLRLAWHPRVRAAVAEAAAREGHNVAASRLTTGNHPLHAALERRLARAFGFPAAVLAPTGYTAPLVAAQALAPELTHVFVAAPAHGCLHDAARLTGAAVAAFPADDPAALRALLRRAGRRARVAVFTDGLSPLHGTVPPLADHLAALPADGRLLVDDAHGVGVLGGRGRGALELAGLRDPRLVLCCTLSKALGGYGGAVLGPRALRDTAHARSRVFGGGTPLPPPLAAGTLAALDVLDDEGPALRARLAANVARFRTALAGRFPEWAGQPGPMHTVVPASARARARLRRRLLDAGVHPPLIRYADGPAERFFRFALGSAHTAAQVDALAAALRDG